MSKQNLLNSKQNPFFSSNYAKKVLNSLIFFIVLVSITSCTKQRDLYVLTSPLFVVRADWTDASINPLEATALVFNQEKPVLDFPYMIPATTTQVQKIEPDTYNVLVFNNIMFGPNVDDNGFSYIEFKGSEHFNTFEAHAILKPNVNPLYKASLDEVHVENPDLISASTYRNKRVEFDREFVMKYKDGIGTGNPINDYLNDSVKVRPVKLTRNVQVILRVKNYKSAFSIVGTLRGFAQGVNMTTRLPVGNSATHPGFIINGAKPDTDPNHKDRHILKSNVFSTFGPWWDDPIGTNAYKLDILAYYNGQGLVYSYQFDVSKYIEGVVSQWVESSIDKIKIEEAAYSNGLLFNGPVPKMETIIIEVWLTLPEVVGDDDGLDVGINDWGNVVIIDIPIRF